MTAALLFGLLHAVSIGFALVALWRLFGYIKRYQFDETKYTLLFGFVHLRFIAVAYFIFAILWIFGSFLFLATL